MDAHRPAEVTSVPVLDVMNTLGTTYVEMNILDATYVDQLAELVVTRQALTGARAERARVRVHRLLRNLGENLAPGDQIPLDAMQPADMPRSGIILAKGEDGILRVLRPAGT